MSSEDIIVAFNNKKRNCIIVGVLFGAASLGYFLYWQIIGLEFHFLIIGIAALAIPLNIFFFTYWNCPNCKVFLGRSYDIEECPNCKCSFINAEEHTKVINSSLKKPFWENKAKNKTSIDIPPNVPDYKNYDIYNLVEIYNRIDHQSNEYKIKLIDEQIRKKLDIDTLVDLNNPEIQKRFEEILENEKPMTGEEAENYEISKILGRIQLISFIAAILAFIPLFTEYKNDMFLSLGIVFSAIIILIEFLKGFFSNEILTVWRSTVNLKENPTLFRFNQVLLFVFFLLITIGFFRSL